MGAYLPANLRDLRRLNRWFGGSSTLTNLVRAELGTDRGPISILDVGTGSGDLPLALVHWGQRNGLSLQLAALDTHPEILAEAERLTHGTAIHLIQGDARSLPMPDASYDLVTCSLVLHHFDQPGAIQVLSELGRVASRAVIVLDLVRSYPAYLGAWLATHTVAASRLTRHDGPLSVLRSYTPDELTELAVTAGLTHLEVRPQPFFRQSLVARRHNHD